MKRFLSTTAVLVALSSAAYAESHAAANMDANADMSANMEIGAITFEQGDFYASDLIGMRIYSVETEIDDTMTIADGAEREWDDIGEINDVIVSADGTVRAVILGVGGFLGIGEKDVSVSMDSIKVLQEDGDMGDRFLVVNTSQEALENAPAFERTMGMDAETTASASMENNDTTVVTTDTETAATTEPAATADTDTAATAETETDATVTTTETAAAEPATDGTMLVRPTMEREGYANVEMEEVRQLTSDMIEGAYVYGANDETVGEIDTLLMSDDGQVEQAVINVGGFLGLGEKPVAVSFDQIQVLRNADGDEYRFYIDSTEEKLEALPEYQN